MTEQAMVFPSFIQQIVALAEANQFGEGPDEAVGEGEKVLTEMTSWEKACYEHRGGLTDQMKKKVEEGISPDQAEIQTLMRHSKVVNDILWASIQERIDDGIDGIGIRSGWQVVQTKKEECDCPACRAAKRGHGIHIIGVGIL